jgi:hypothetical protein
LVCRDKLQQQQQQQHWCGGISSSTAVGVGA